MSAIRYDVVSIASGMKGRGGGGGGGGRGLQF